MNDHFRTLLAIPRPVFYLGVAWLVVLVAAIAFGPSTVPHVDFDAFYCAGDSVAHGDDPYRDRPLNACEQRIHSGGPATSGTTVPAPLPPYALAPYALLARLPAKSAYVLFTYLSVAALFATLAPLTRLTGASTLLGLAAMGSTAYDDVLKGQPVPFVLLAIVVSGLGLRCGSPRLAAGAAAATMLEPHIGLPICAALFLWSPRTRGTLLVAALVLGSVSFLTVPAHVVLAYLTAVLPMQAASEATWATQLSLTDALAVLGVPTRFALTVGFVQYALTAMIGIAVARGVAVRLEAPEALAFLPPLFAVIGGTYIHNSLLLVAIPASLLVVQHYRSFAAYAALVGIAAYWIAIADPINCLAIIFSAYTVAYSWRNSVKGSILSGAVVATLGFAYTWHQPIFGTPPLFSSSVGDGYAEESWARFVSAVNPDIGGQRLALLMKLPTWTGLLWMSGLAVAMMRRPGRLVQDRLGTSTRTLDVRRSTGDPRPAAVLNELS